MIYRGSDEDVLRNAKGRNEVVSCFVTPTLYVTRCLILTCISELFGTVMFLHYNSKRPSCRALIKVLVEFSLLFTEKYKIEEKYSTEKKPRKFATK